MDLQWGFNAAVTLAAFLGGWVLNSLRSSIDRLHKADAELVEKVQRVEVIIAGDYVRREDMDTLARALFAKLDKIDDKLDKKADK